jgi:hypothetical protein
MKAVIVPSQGPTILCDKYSYIYALVPKRQFFSFLGKGGGCTLNKLETLQSPYSRFLQLWQTHYCARHVGRITDIHTYMLNIYTTYFLVRPKFTTLG